MWRAFLFTTIGTKCALSTCAVASLFSCACPRRLQVISFSRLFSRRSPMDSCICVYFAMSTSVIVLLDQRQSTMWCPRFNILMLIILKYTCLGAYLFQRTDLRFSPIPCLLFLFLKVHDLPTDRSVLSKDITSYIIEISRGLTRRWMLSFNTSRSPMDRERKRKCQHEKEKALSSHKPWSFRNQRTISDSVPIHGLE